MKYADLKQLVTRFDKIEEEYLELKKVLSSQFLTIAISCSLIGEKENISNIDIDINFKDERITMTGRDYLNDVLSITLTFSEIEDYFKRIELEN